MEAFCKDVSSLIIQKISQKEQVPIRKVCKLWKEVIDLLANNGVTNWNLTLRRACYGGNIEIINRLIEQEADNWNDALYGACNGNHKEIIKLMIAKETTQCYCGKGILQH